MKWLWVNTTQVGFGQGCVREHMARFVKPNSKVLCTFGGGSIDTNGCRADVTAALAALHCNVEWHGAIGANPDYVRLMEIVAAVKAFQPDLILSVGGGSVLDGTKFIALAAKLEDGKDAWQMLVTGDYPKVAFPVGAVMTIPATGSEWNSFFVISRYSTNEKLLGTTDISYPLFSLMDPLYTMTLPARQLRNGVFDAFCHCCDQFLTPQPLPMMDGFWMSIMRELVDIGADVIKEDSSIELKERLIVACSFALNFVFTLGKAGCWGIHMIGHQITAKYDIDHGATLAMVTPVLLESQFERRRVLLAKVGERVFDITTGTEEEKARACIQKMKEWILSIGHQDHVSGHCPCKPEDVNEIVQMVMTSVGNKPFGFQGQIDAETTRAILQKIVH
jgi:alcohol dehydrogenase YqhD (iron-dependent ADH family)